MVKRIEYLDVAKGIGILLVVFGHVISKDTVAWNFIYGFHMPFFVFCSGIFYKKNRWKKNFLRTLFSYFLMGIAGVSVWYLLLENGNVVYLKQSIYNILVGGVSPRHGIYPVEALWYLSAYALILLIHSFVQKIQMKRMAVLTVSLIAIAGVALGEVVRPTHTMYYNIDISMVLYPFFYLGTEWNKFRNLPQSQILSRKLSVIAACIVYLSLCLFNGCVNVYRAEYGECALILYCTGVLGIFLILFFAEKIICGVKMLCCLNQLFKQVGKHTLIIMGGHQLIIQYFRICLGIENYFLIFCVAVLSTFLLSFAVSQLLSGGEKWFRNLSFKKQI